MFEYPQDYFEDEVRDGYYVNGFMKRCWAAQMEVLTDIDRVCEKYGIKWYADCGTLLGAVRHGGFIPWDDDLDICMFREDYVKFLSVAEKELKSIYSGYIIRNFHNDDHYWEMLSRVDNALIMEFNEEHLDKFKGYPFRAGVDIFPLDYLSPDKEAEEERTKLAQMIFSVCRRDDLMELNDEVEEYLDAIESSCNIRFKRDDQLRRQLYDFGEKVFSLFDRTDADSAVLMPYWLCDYSHVYPLGLYDDTIEIPFETGVIKAPAAYDAVLKIEYGDYMKIVRTGSAHEYPYHEEHMALLEEEMGVRSPFHKRVGREDINIQIEHDDNDNPRKVLVEQIKGCLNLLEEAHEEIVKIASDGQNSAVINMLEQCQELAIQTGTIIEESYGEGTSVVKSLEDYCELVYKYHEQMVNNAGLIKSEEYNENMYSDLSGQLTCTGDRMNEDIRPRKEIVFFPYKPSKWMYMENEWERACSLPDTDVYVIPIPYYHKNCLGAIESEHYDVEGYPDYVDIIDYNSYNYEINQPDKIYIQVPYDDDNYSLTVNPYFYAKNLKKYTDELVYLPCFVQEEFDISDERAYKTMNYYAVSPGVVYADRVILQSEHMKDMYVKKLVDFFGEDSKNIWESKLEAKPEDYDMAAMKRSKADIPEEWRDVVFRSDGSTKKVILYNIGVDSLAEYGDRMIDKIRASLNIFKDNKEDVALIWRSDPLIREAVAVNDSKLYLKYSAAIDEYKRSGYGIYYEGNDTEKLLEIIDAYYGDVDKLIQKCRSRKIPVMIQNVEV